MSEETDEQQECCNNCRYSSSPFTNYYPDQSVSPVALLRCHRRSPVVCGGQMSPAWTAWPLVRRTDWCGEYKMENGHE